MAAEPYLGEISLVGFNFAPRGWANCDGQLLPIAQYQALFSLFGTMYGGDGRTTFGLPDLRGRVPIHAGQGPGLPAYIQGSKGGVVSTHLKTQKANDADESDATDDGAAADADATSGSAVDVGQPIDVMQPYQTLRYVVALVGLFPSRS